ncbi:MAG: YitT family protein [Bacilli bacterium]|nr:YitT family protein [Bacilli bacterium]
MGQNINKDLKNEIHFKELSQVEQEKVQLKKKIKAYIGVILGTIIYSVGVVWILRLGGFFSGGATGASQLIVGLFEKFNPGANITKFMSNNLGTFILLINIPLFLLGWRGVSKHFVILTAVSIILQTVIMNLLSMYTISPFVLLVQDGAIQGLVNGYNETTLETYGVTREIMEFLKVDSTDLIDIIRSGHFNIYKSDLAYQAQSFFSAHMSTGTRLLLAVIGGFVCGLGAAICLKSGGSTGGMDIVANYLQVKKQLPFTKIQSTVDTVIILSSVIVSVENVLFTLVRLVVYMTTIDRVYKTYKTNRIEIVTSKPEELRVALLTYLGHGLTIYQCVGGFTNSQKATIVVYASSFETPLYVEAVKEVDPKAFISVTKTLMIKGNYVQKTIN